MSRSRVSRTALLFLTLLLTGAMALSWFAQVGSAACSVPNFQTSTFVSSVPTSLVVDDFNKDGNQDFAVAEDVGTDTVAIFLGNGSGGFAAPTRFAMGRDPDSLASGDLNGDGNPDLVVANGTNVSGRLSIALGNGTGGFGTPTNILNGTGNQIAAVAVGDVNGDTKPDILLSSSVSHSITVMLGNGSGSATFSKNVGSGGLVPIFLAMRDLNGDGKLDLVTANSGSDNVSVLLGDGAGDFGPAATFAIGRGPRWIAVTDVNGDGKLDLAVTNAGTGEVSVMVVSILIGNGAGAFGPATSFSAPAEPPLSVAAADFNGDGKVDLAVSSVGIVVFSGDGAGGFSPVAHFRNGGLSPVVADFNEDGQPDLVVTNGNAPNVSVLLNTCGSTALPEFRFFNPSETTLEAGFGNPNAIKVIRTGDTTGTASVDYATSNGTATAPEDYTSISGTLNFLPGEISKVIQVSLIDDTLTEPNETFSLTLSNVTGMATLGSPSVMTIHIIANDPLPTVQFETTLTTGSESIPSRTVQVNRTGNTQLSSSVDYATSDSAGSASCNATNGSASSRCDYLTTIGTLHFAVGETMKTISIPIVDDVYVEQSESLTVTLSNPTGATLGTPSTHTLTINANDSPGEANPIDQPSFFVRQHYVDFLNREPDAAGLAFWANQITECQQPGATCNAEVRRINVSAAFFLSIEFQETGYLVYKFYKAAYGNLAGAPVPLSLNEFLPDTQQIGQGLVVGETGWPQKLESNKVAYAQAFVSRSRFSTAHPTTRTPVELVDALFANAGVTPSATDRDAAISEFAGAANTADTAARGRALRRVAENAALSQQEFNRAFVLMQYFGYLRRNPNDAPEPGLNFDGYNFWLGKLNEFNGNYIAAELVKAFISSGEYRQRFGP